MWNGVLSWLMSQGHGLDLIAQEMVSLQRIPIKLTHSQHVESSCGILHEKVSE